MTAASILIVDDEARNRMLLEALLLPEGYATRSAASGEEALAMVAERAPDLVLLDVMMPGLDGRRVAGMLKADPATAHIPIIMVTAQSDRDARLAALAAGAEEFLTKPVDRAELWVRVRNLLRLKAYADLLHAHGENLEREVQARTIDLQRFRTAMDSTDDAIVLTNFATMRIFEANATACEMLGFTREEIFMADLEQLGRSTRDELADGYAALIAGGGGDTRETALRRKDGSELEVEVRRSAMHSGADWVIVSVARDITERKRAERELRESERRFSSLLQNLQMASVMLDHEARITYCNEYLLKLTGWRFDEIAGRNWFELFIPEQGAGAAKDYFATLLEEAPAAWYRENTILTRSGERRLMCWHNSVLRSGTGEVIGSASIGEDITERRKGEARIVHLNRVHAVLSGINSLIVRAPGREELFREACRIAVEQGRFSLAWVGIVDRQAMELKVVASHDTTNGYVELIRLGLDESAPGGLGMAGRAVFERWPIIVNDIEADAGFLLKPQALARGFRSIVALPLMDVNGVNGVLTLYADTADYFDHEEMQLLLELAGDISFAMDHLAKADRINYLDRYDALTGLANRALFLERVTGFVQGAAAQDHRLAVLVIDVDRFKLINETLGREAGDRLLRQIAERLLLKPANQNLLARIGADQFCMVLPAMQSAQGLAQRIERDLQEWFGERFMVDATELKIAVRAGVALYPNNGEDAETLLTNAEAALRKAKAGGETALFYTRDMSPQVSGKLTMENQLRQALEKGEFVLHYQPKVDFATQRVVGAEALIRWNDPRTGLVPPARFIPILEETGLIHDVGRWALDQAILDYQGWRDAGLRLVRIAVNVSPLQLRGRDFVAQVRARISAAAKVAAGLELEITESLIMDDVTRNIASLNVIREMGVTIALDDFGTGYSSLSLLRRLPVDTLKIDRSFVMDLTSGPQARALVSTIISLAHSLGLKVVAEGVETAEQSRLLQSLKCDQMQGFLFSKPVPKEMFQQLFLKP